METQLISQTLQGTNISHDEKVDSEAGLFFQEITEFLEQDILAMDDIDDTINQNISFDNEIGSQLFLSDLTLDTTESPRKTFDISVDNLQATVSYTSENNSLDTKKEIPDLPEHLGKADFIIPQDVMSQDEVINSAVITVPEELKLPTQNFNLDVNSDEIMSFNPSSKSVDIRNIDKLSYDTESESFSFDQRFQQDAPFYIKQENIETSIDFRTSTLSEKCTEQVKVALMDIVKEGKEKISINLEPRELGKIQINVESGKNNIKEITIFADKISTFELLQKSKEEFCDLTKNSEMQTNLNFQYKSFSDDKENSRSQNFLKSASAIKIPSINSFSVDCRSFSLDGKVNLIV